MSICNVRRSTIDREADGHLYMNAGVEIAWQVQKPCQHLAVLDLFAIQFMKAKGCCRMVKKCDWLKSFCPHPVKWKSFSL